MTPALETALLILGLVGLGLLLRSRGGRGSETARRLAPQAAAYRALLSTSQDGLHVLDAEGNVVEANESFCRLLGYTHEEALRLNVADWDAQWTREELKGRIAAFIGHSGIFETRHRRRDGAILEVEISVTGVALPDRPLLFCAARDISQRVRDEARLRKLSRAVEQSPASIVITDLEGRIEYVNPKFTQVTGYTQQEALGQNPRLLKSGVTPPEVYQELWATITAGREWRGELHNRKKNGEPFWETASISPILDADGRITHYLAVKEDITERKRLEEQLRQSQKLEAIGRLAGGIAHDFNNVLGVISGFGELLRRRLDVGSGERRKVDEILKAADRAAALTRQLLAFSRKQVLAPRVLDVNHVVAGMDEMLRRLLGEDVELLTSLRASRGPVMADPGQLEQVILNLAVNARDAMPDGGRLTIATDDVDLGGDDVRRRPVVAPGPYVLLSIRDTGQGIPPELQERIFEPFFTTKGFGKGTGLGLATVYGIVKQSGGNIWVYSEPGHGTEFKVYLPRLEPQPTDDSTAPRAATPATGGDETILLVEDEPALRDVTSEALQEAGYRVLSAEGGQAALRVARAHEGPIPLLLTDMVMPDLGGREVARLLRQVRPELRVLLMSGFSEHASLRQGSMAGADGFIEKPFHADDLLRRVRAILDSPKAS